MVPSLSTHLDFPILFIDRSLSDKRHLPPLSLFRSDDFFNFSLLDMNHAILELAH